MYDDYMILGGAGLVGTQVVRNIVRELRPTRIIIGSLLEEEAKSACAAHEREFGKSISFVPVWGNQAALTSDKLGNYRDYVSAGMQRAKK